jgi:hypothetical protein
MVWLDQSRAISVVMTGWLISVAEEDRTADSAISLFAVWEADASRACSLLGRRMHLADQRLVVIKELSDAALRGCGAQPKRIASVSGTMFHNVTSRF